MVCKSIYHLQILKSNLCAYAKKEKGCCFSTSRSDSRSPYHSTNPSAIPPTDSLVPIAQAPSSHTPQNITQASTSSLVGNDHTARARSLLAASHSSPLKHHGSRTDTPNKPLQRAPSARMIEPPPVASPQGEPQPAHTMASLRRARDEFFETRVSGRIEMWSAVRTICEMIEQGDLGDAQAILDASGGTCPSGLMWGRKGGCYDERGERYVVPTWCLGKPSGIVDDDGDELDGRSRQEGEKRQSGRSEDSALADEIRLFSKNSKGKGRTIPDHGAIKGTEIKVKVRLSHTARDVVVTVGNEDNVELLIRRAKSLGGVS